MTTAWTTPVAPDRYQDATIDGAYCSAGTNAIDAPEERVPWSCLLSGLSHEEARQVGGVLPRHLARVERPDGSETMAVEVRGVERTAAMAREMAEVCAGVMARRVECYRRAVA
mgnify:CR=1 FL=1